MKKLILVALMSVATLSVSAQKKKASSAVKSAVLPKGVLAKVDNLVAEIKNGMFQITIDGKDVLNVKNADAKFSPTDVKMKSFTASGTKLYLLTWTEKNTIKTDLKTEDITSIYTNVYEITNKKQVFSNYQITNNIVEKVFLDRLKTASETQMKTRREGFEFTLNADGTITQKSKTQENKWVYDAAKVDFVDAKKKK